MKIAHIAPPWIPVPPKNYGGTEIVIYNLVEEQIKQGHEVVLFAPGDAKTSARHISFFPQSLVEERVPWAAHHKAYYHLVRALEYHNEFDIIHTHVSSSPDLAIFPLTAHLKTPHVTTLHSCFPFDRVEGVVTHADRPAQTWIGDADELYMHWAPLIPLVAISESARRAALYDWATPEVTSVLNFVGTIHHGLPIEQFPFTGERPEDYFAWLGVFTFEKGTHIAIEAAKRANVPLILAGIVDQHNQKSVQYFERMIKPHIDDKQVKYIGPVNMQQKIRLLSKARGLLVPLQWEEPFGMVMVEAMVLGCPVIAFARGSAPEIVLHQKTGFLAHDLDEMVQCMRQSHEIDRGVTRRHIEENFSVCAMTRKYVDVYQKLL